MGLTRYGKKLLYGCGVMVVVGLAALACRTPEIGPFTATATPSSTVAPSATPTPFPTPAPTPTPTPLPADLLQLGNDSLFVGDTTAAEMAFQAALTSSQEEPIVNQALFGLGNAYLQDGAYAEAATVFEELLIRFPNTPFTHDSRFLLAEALVGAGDPATAAFYYQAYLDDGTMIDAYVHEWRGDALTAAAQYDEALLAYEAAIDSAPDLSFQVGVREKLALLHVARVDYAAALAEYEAILAEARIPDYRARIVHQQAQTMLLAGQFEEGYARHMEVIEAYPTNHWAYESLVVLVDAGIEVDDLTRGTVDYYGGAYGPAVAALYRYIGSNPEHSGTAHYYAAMSHLAAGSPALAAEQFEVLIETHPESERWGDAWMGWAQALREQGDVEGAVATYRAFVDATPDHVRAAEALWNAARLLDGDSAAQETAQAYEFCQVAYPGSDYAAPALLRAGLQYYWLDALAEAQAAWQRLADGYPAYRAAGLFWLGKSYLVAGQPISATAAFGQAVDAAPGSYYALRAAELHASPPQEPFPPSAYSPPDGPNAGREEAERWLADWLGLADSANLGALDPLLAGDPRLQRGQELWRLGRREEAKSELEMLRQATADDPLSQYRLALFLRDLGLYRSSIMAAANLIRLSPAATPLDAPPFLARLAYPTYYADLVEANALNENLPPLLVFSLIRQESLFEGFATSWAYAHGLMQVIPSTGAEIAGRLGWPPDYETGDLYRPVVSVRFGTWYLAQQRDAFDGRIDAALAAYNGGPGNAARWLEIAAGDPDLLVESITLRETRSYVQLIREHYAIYVALYDLNE